MKDALLKFLKETLGASVWGFLLRVVIAGILFASGAVTNVGDAVGIALDKEKSIAQAVDLINETPKREILQAVKSEKPEEVPVAVEVIPLIPPVPSDP